jgi:hypothetical protein
MNAKKVTLVVVGSFVAFALAAAPASKQQDLVVNTQQTPYSADHARIQGEPEELPPQF